MSAQCRCPDPTHGPPRIGTSLGSGVVGNWQALPEAHTENAPHALLNCECGCNAYSPQDDPLGAERPVSVFPPPIPVLPLAVEYEDDDGPSDDHEYISIKITDFADMQSAIQSCTCQDH